MNKEVKFIKFNILKLIKIFDNKDIANLSWGVRMGYPRITVFTSNDTGVSIYDRMITAPFDIITFNMFVGNLLDVSNYEKGQSTKIECLNIKYENGEKTNDIYVQATVVIGKDNDGVNYIAVVAEGKKKVKFDLLPSKFHRFYNKNKELIEDKAELSDSFTDAYADILVNMINPYIINNSIVDVKPGNNNSKKTTSVEDELGLD